MFIDMGLKNQGFLRSNSSGLSLLNRFMDALIIWLCARQLCLSNDLWSNTYYQFATFLAIASYLALAEIRGLYQSARINNYTEIVSRIVFTWINIGALLILIGFLTKTSANFSRVLILSWLVITPIFLVASRLLVLAILHSLRRSGRNTRSFAILGPQDKSCHLLKKISDMPWLGLSCSGIFEDLESLILHTRDGHIDYIFLTYPYASEKEIIQATNALSNRTSSVFLTPDLFASELLGSRWLMFENMPMISIYDHPFYGSQLVYKRLEDYFLSSTIILVISPLLLLIALCIMATSKGPILFKQRRYGLNGEVIEVYKFRTMNVLENGALIPQASKVDPRITTVGAFLRKTSFDELPQFFNVLKGDMSIVGPRPHAVSHNEHYRTLIHGYMLRHKVKPGITGWAQVNGFRGETETLDKMQSRVEYDLFYINNWTLGLDLKIIGLTIFKGFINKNAY
jgi:putative colanic acid biosynthesis UDP-glucose lipid carrier transferase